MSCRQVFCRRGPEASGGSHKGPALWGHQNSWDVTLSSAKRTVFRWAGEFGNFVLRLTTAPGVGKSWTYTFYKNGSATALAVTISDAATDGRSTVLIAISPGDTGHWERTSTGSPASHIPKMTYEFIHADDYVSGYSGAVNISSAGAAVAPLSAYGTASYSVIPTPGDLTALDYVLVTAPGSGKSYTLTLRKNGVAQDGSGGTPNTTVTISDLATTGAWAGTVSLVAGDYIDVNVVGTSTPASSALTVASTFSAATDGVSIIAGSIAGQSPPRFYAPTVEYAGAPDAEATETPMEQLGGVSSFVLSDWYGRWSNTSFDDFVNPHTYEVRVNGATPGSTLSTTYTGPTLTGSDTTNSLTIADGDVWCVSVVAGAANFGGAGLSSSFAQFAIGQPPQIIGSHVVGADGTVNTSLTGLINLDGVTRTVSGSGVEFIGGSLGMLEQASPPAAIAGTALIFAEDNGAGKLRLMCQFPTGSAQQLAIEP